jgi:hypothetical protein
MSLKLIYNKEILAVKNKSEFHETLIALNLSWIAYFTVHFIVFYFTLHFTVLYCTVPDYCNNTAVGDECKHMKRD